MVEFTDASVEEIIEKEVAPFGTSSHIILPKQHEGKKASVVIFKKNFIEEFKRKIYNLNPKLKKVPKNVVQEILSMIIKPSLINLDLDELKEIFDSKGEIFIYSGKEEKALENLKKIDCKRVMLLYECRPNIKLKDFSDLATKITDKVGYDCQIIVGAKINQEVKETKLTLVAVGNKKISADKLVKSINKEKIKEAFKRKLRK